MRFTRLICTLLSITVLLSLITAGCKGTGTEANNKKIPVVEKVRIDYWWNSGFGGGVRQNAEKKAVDNFNEKQDKIFVKMQAVAGTGGKTSYDEKLFPAIAGGTPPDIIFTDGVISDAVQHELLLDITDMVERDKFSYDIFYQYKTDQCIYKGRYYAMPYCADYVGAMVYNKTMFKKYGLDPNQPPTTLEQVESYAEAMYVRGEDGYYTSIGFMPWDWLYRRNESVVAPFGGSFADANGNPDPKNPIVLESLTWLMKFVNKYGYTQVNDSLAKLGAPVAANGANEGFAKGHIGMLYTFNRQVQDLLEREVSFEWDICKFPTKNPSNLNPGWGRGLLVAIPKESRRPDEAFEFLKYIAGDEAQTILMDNIPRGKWLSPSKAANEHIRGQIPAQVQFFIDEVFPVIGGEQVVSRNWASYVKLCDDTIADIITGKQELMAGIDDLERKTAVLFNENEK